MGYLMIKSIVYVTILSLFARTVVSIDCYQCSGTDSNYPFECNEFLDSGTNLNSSSCANIYDAKFCIKHVGRFEGGIGTKRFCSSLDLGNYCNYVQHPGDKLEYRTCLYTCGSDGCNSATTGAASMLAIVTAVFVSSSIKLIL